MDYRCIWEGRVPAHLSLARFLPEPVALTGVVAAQDLQVGFVLPKIQSEL